MPAGFSYIRFSSLQQRDGDSEWRQKANLDSDEVLQFLADRNITLDDRTFQDFGKSGYAVRKKNTTKRLQVRTAQEDLQQFLDLVADGIIPKGSYLFVEALDRLSRDTEEEALGLMLDIIRAGIIIVTIRPRIEVFERGKLDMTRLIIAIADVSRAHRYSLGLSDRLSKWWDKTRGTQRMVPRPPAWINRTSAGFVLIPEKTKTIRLIYDLCIRGLGTQQILRHLLHNKIPPIAKKGWSKSYIDLLLSSKNVIGEYQPHLGKVYDRQPIGEPIPNYYPPAITEATYNKAQLAKASRRKQSGRPAKGINVFAGLIYDDETGCKVYRQGAWLILSNYLEGISDNCVKFPAEFTERALLELLITVPPSEVVGNETSQLPDLEDKLLAVENNIKLIQQRMNKGKQFESLLNLLVKEEEAKEAIIEAIREEKTKQPMKNTYKEFRGAVSTLEGLEGEELEQAKQNLQAIAKRTIKEIRISFHTRNYDRAFAAKVTFTSGAYVTVWGGYRYARRGNSEAWGMFSSGVNLQQGAIRALDSIEKKKVAHSK